MYTVALPTVYTFLIAMVTAEIRLEHLYTEYVPSGYDPITKEFMVDAAEQCVIDPNQHIVYVAGLHLVHVYNFSNPRDVQYQTHYQYQGADGEMTDVETCAIPGEGAWLAAAFDNFDRPREGKVFIFNTYDGGPLTLLHEVTVGALPDMVKFTSDCRKVLVAMEGELRVDENGEVYDPEGGLGVITFTNNPSDTQAPSYKFIDFKDYNSREAELVAAGVRKVYNGQGTNYTTTLSQDLEPEYIAISEDDKTVWVVLQENNALARVSLETESVEDIYSFGYFSWGTDGKLDPSDQDGGIHRNNWDIRGLTQPDGARIIMIDGVPYLITGNEGDVKSYRPPSFNFTWDERKQGNTFTDDEIDPSVSAELRAALKDDTKLGRMMFSSVDGNDNGIYKTFYSYGARSISMFRLGDDDVTMTYTSGDELGEKFAELYPEVFNADVWRRNETPEETMDGRSPFSGLDAEIIETGEVNGRTLIFIGIEQPGAIGIYSLEGTVPKFETIVYSGGHGPKTWEQLWEDRETRDLDPEDLRFLPADRSPTGNPILVVSGCVSGTLSFYDVIDDTPPGTDGGEIIQVNMVSITASFMVVLNIQIFKY